MLYTRLFESSSQSARPFHDARFLAAARVTAVVSSSVLVLEFGLAHSHPAHGDVGAQIFVSSSGRLAHCLNLDSELLPVTRTKTVLPRRFVKEGDRASSAPPQGYLPFVRSTHPGSFASNLKYSGAQAVELGACVWAGPPLAKIHPSSSLCRTGQPRLSAVGPSSYRSSQLWTSAQPNACEHRGGFRCLPRSALT